MKEQSFYKLRNFLFQNHSDMFLTFPVILNYDLISKYKTLRYIKINMFRTTTWRNWSVKFGY
jgi:hypothetical protein